jgi:hypothetical protein
MIFKVHLLGFNPLVIRYVNVPNKFIGCKQLTYEEFKDYSLASEGLYNED